MDTTFASFGRHAAKPNMAFAARPSPGRSGPPQRVGTDYTLAEVAAGESSHVRLPHPRSRQALLTGGDRPVGLPQSEPARAAPSPDDGTDQPSNQHQRVLPEASAAGRGGSTIVKDGAATAAAAGMPACMPAAGMHVSPWPTEPRISLSLSLPSPPAHGTHGNPQGTRSRGPSHGRHAAEEAGP
eukprot:scaffold48_cov395-Prasinococcus_capsulatus_cf.AAC.36